jgi:hypothetical protein
MVGGWAGDVNACTVTQGACTAAVGARPVLSAPPGYCTYQKADKPCCCAVLPYLVGHGCCFHQINYLG